MRASAAARPCDLSESASVIAKAAPRRLSALGGSSSTKSSTSRLFFVVISGSLLLVLELLVHFVGPGLGRHREAQAGAAVEVALRHRPREVADAADVGRALGHADGAARIEQVEGVG